MFKLHALLVDALSKIKQAINKIIIRQECSGRHPTKDASFDIQSLVDQLYYSRSSTLQGSKSDKIYFLAYPAPDLLKDSINQLHISI